MTFPPRSYSAFGLRIDSDLELSGFVPREDGPGDADVTVRLGTPQPASESDDRIWARAEGVLNASVQGGREIVLQVNAESDLLYVSAIITGELFSVILRQRGLLVLHGSGVTRDGQAVGFVGDSGWGKSTLAASLVERGWQLLTDDLLVVDGLSRPGTPTAVPTHPSMRLSTEAIDHVDAGDGTRGQAHANTSKMRVEQVTAFSDQPAPLSHVFVLDPSQSEHHQSTPLHGIDAVDEFVRHTRGRRLMTTPRAMAAHLSQCAALARDVPTAALRRQYGLDHLDALCDLVEAKVGVQTTAA